ncbi:hypothetical protein B9Z65_6895 [Elsinoe australis]|uniref:Uncharacterized protein n=1 Tax=Elsinoe australis TaxID=40998 RepID=A0A2P7Z414_9PEZI|nr:hypothetical protein B9Z65_6895 [Elsinoe australis]
MDAVLEAIFGLERSKMQNVQDIMHILTQNVPQFTFTSWTVETCSCIEGQHDFVQGAFIQGSVINIPYNRINSLPPHGSLQALVSAVFEPYTLPRSNTCSVCDEPPERQLKVLDRCPLRLITGETFTREKESIQDIFSPIVVRVKDREDRNIQATYHLMCFISKDI